MSKAIEAGWKRYAAAQSGGFAGYGSGVGTKAGKRRLYVKPARAPDWWPRDEHRRPKFVGVLKGGCGWVVGDGDPMTQTQRADAKEVLRWDMRSPRFEVR